MVLNGLLAATTTTLDVLPIIVMGAKSLAERLREHVALDPLPGLPSVDRVTLSIGLACWEGGDDTLDLMLSRADKALYQAKAEGRNRVIG